MGCKLSNGLKIAKIWACGARVFCGLPFRFWHGTELLFTVAPSLLPENKVYTYYVYDANGMLMKTYDLTITNTEKNARIAEEYLYGMGRIGMKKPREKYSWSNDAQWSAAIPRITSREYGSKNYELTNYLGNVNVVITDRRVSVNSLDEETEVVFTSDYYPFGMMMPGTQYSSDSYRYTFQGQECDDEVKGAGNSVNYKYRMHDPRVGRFFAVDPLADKYPFYSPFAFSGNRVIDAIELEGLEPVVFNGYLVGYTVKKGQGPSQIAEDINNPQTQIDYGYNLTELVNFTDIVNQNKQYFKSVSKVTDPNDPGYSKSSMNPGDFVMLSEQGLKQLERDANKMVDGLVVEAIALLFEASKKQNQQSGSSSGNKDDELSTASNSHNQHTSDDGNIDEYLDEYDGMGFKHEWNSRKSISNGYGFESRGQDTNVEYFSIGKWHWGDWQSKKFEILINAKTGDTIEINHIEEVNGKKVPNGTIKSF